VATGTHNGQAHDGPVFERRHWHKTIGTIKRFLHLGVEAVVVEALQHLVAQFRFEIVRKSAPPRNRAATFRADGAMAYFKAVGEAKLRRALALVRFRAVR